MPINNFKIKSFIKPTYLLELRDVSLYYRGDVVKWIGMKNQSIDNTVKDFLWWKNFRFDNCNDYDSRSSIADFFSELYLGMGVEACLGYAIDFNNCNSNYDRINFIFEHDLFGVYVEADKRRLFNFKFMRDFNSDNFTNKNKLMKIDIYAFNRVHGLFLKNLPFDLRH